MQPEAVYNRIESHDWSFCLEMWHANQIECHRWHHLINRRWQIDDSIERGIWKNYAVAKVHWLIHMSGSSESSLLVNSKWMCSVAEVQSGDVSRVWLNWNNRSMLLIWRSICVRLHSQKRPYATIVTSCFNNLIKVSSDVLCDWFYSFFRWAIVFRQSLHHSSTIACMHATDSLVTRKRANEQNDDVTVASLVIELCWDKSNHERSANHAWWIINKQITKPNGQETNSNLKQCVEICRFDKCYYYRLSWCRISRQMMRLAATSDGCVPETI